MTENTELLHSRVRPNLARVWSFRVFDGIGLVGLLVLTRAPVFVNLRAAIIFLGLMVIAANVTVIIVHEVGHIIVGTLVGFRWQRVGFGRTQLRRVGHRLNMRKSYFHPGLGAFISMVPGRMHNLRRRMIATVAAGPFFSLISGILLALLMTSMLNIDADPWITMAVGWFALRSINSGVRNCIPSMLRNGISNDGMKLRTLLEGGPRSAYMQAMMAVGGLSHKRVRPRDWDESLIESVIALDDGSLSDIHGLLAAYTHAEDSGDYGGARTYLERIERYVDDHPHHKLWPFFAEMAYFKAFVEADPSTARAYFSRIDPDWLEDEERLLLVEAAVLLAEGNAAQAKEKAIAGLAWVTNEADISAIETGQKILARIEATL